MGGNRGVRGIVLLRTPRRTQGCADAGSRDVGDLRGHHWCVARDGRECAGFRGSSLDRHSKESRSAVDVSAPRAVDGSYPIASRATIQPNLTRRVLIRSVRLHHQQVYEYRVH
jgi:hypothetical protein